MDQQLRYKGRFIKDKVLKLKLRRKEFLKRKQDEWRNATLKEKKYPCEESRIVNLKILGENLKCHNCEKLLSLENVTEENKTELHSVLRIMCDFCSLLTEVTTGEQQNVSDEAKSFVKAKKLKTGANTHWARHNQKMKDKVKGKSELKRPEQILKARKILERKQNRSGKKKGKGQKNGHKNGRRR